MKTTLHSLLLLLTVGLLSQCSTPTSSGDPSGITSPSIYQQQSAVERTQSMQDLHKSARSRGV